MTEIEWAASRNYQTAVARGETATAERIAAAVPAVRPVPVASMITGTAALAALAAGGSRHNRRINLTPLTPGMRTAILWAHDMGGHISVESAGGPRTVRGIEDRGYGEVIYRTMGRRQIVTGLRLNKRGTDLAVAAAKAA